MVHNRSSLELMDLQINTLFQSDPDGRLRSVNEPGNPSPPRFFMGRTVEGNRWRFRYDLPVALVAKLEQLCRAEPISSDLTQPPQNDRAIKAELATQTPIASAYRGPAWWLPTTSPLPTAAILITDANVHLLQPHFPWMVPPTAYHKLGPVAAVVADGCAVAVCFCSRIPGQATEAGVETVEAYRGRGYASAAVALWANAVRDMGCLPLYSTDWENLASQAIARKLGAELYGEDWSLD